MLNSFWGPNSVLYKHCCVPSTRESQCNSTQISKTSPKRLFVCWEKEKGGKELDPWFGVAPVLKVRIVWNASKSPCSLEAWLDSGPAVPKSGDKLCMWGAATAFTLNIDLLVLCHAASPSISSSTCLLRGDGRSRRTISGVAHKASRLK